MTIIKSFQQWVSDFVSSGTTTTQPTATSPSITPHINTSPLPAGTNAISSSGFNLNSSVTMTTVTNISHPIPGNPMQSIGTLNYFGMSKQEADELKLLREEHKLVVREIRLQKFRELHPEMRQMIISLLIIADIEMEISSSGPTKSDRLNELEAKEFYNNYTTTAYVNPDWHWSTVVASLIPQDLTKNDLINAHTQATLEEELSLTTSK